MTVTADQISADIKAHIKALDAERETLMQAMFALEPDTPTEAPAFNLADHVDRDIVEVVAETPGLTATQLTNPHESPRKVARMLARLEREGRVRSVKANKKSATWWPVEP